MVYLLKLQADPFHPSIRQALQDYQDMHRNLKKAFQNRFLYRVIELRTRIEVLVLCCEMADERELGLNGYTIKGVSDLSELSMRYKEGSLLRFNILTSPSKKIQTINKNSKRVFLKKSEERKEWFIRQAEKYGFQTLEVHELSEVKQICVGRKSGRFMVSGIEFEGILKILDSKAFWEAWENGIGSEKAYGMGLMLLSK